MPSAWEDPVPRPSARLRAAEDGKLSFLSLSSALGGARMDPGHGGVVLGGGSKGKPSLTWMPAGRDGSGRQGLEEWGGLSPALEHWTGSLPLWGSWRG